MILLLVMKKNQREGKNVGMAISFLRCASGKEGKERNIYFAEQGKVREKPCVRGCTIPYSHKIDDWSVNYPWLMFTQLLVAAHKGELH